MLEPIRYTQYDLNAAKILDDFLPDKIFDAHAHFYDGNFMQDMYKGRTPESILPDDYRRDMGPLLGGRQVDFNMITWPDRSMGDPSTGTMVLADQFLVEQLNKEKTSVGEILVVPGETADHIEKRLVHDRICGFKCYHFMSSLKESFQAEIGDYLPESAWEIADKHGLCITLHMVRDSALADPANLRYIQTMARRYPNAVLILAHAARAFASWTGVETVEQLADYDNVWFDISAVCESPAIFQILNKTGTQRIMWGSDYDVSRLRGKAISLGDSFYWIYEQDLDMFESKTTLSFGLIGTENLMASRQACIMAGLTQDEVECVFYRNARNLFCK